MKVATESGTFGGDGITGPRIGIEQERVRRCDRRGKGLERGGGDSRAAGTVGGRGLHTMFQHGQNVDQKWGNLA